jgi:DNA primase
LDGDKAGQAAAEKYRAILSEAKPGVKLSQVLTPDDEDVNSLLDGHEPEILTELLSNRQGLESSKSETFSFSTEKSNETQSTEKENQPTDPRPEKPTKSELDSTNPANLIYKGQPAEYQIKGFKITQLDSLKVSLQILRNGHDFRARIELYDYKHTQGVSQKSAKVLDVEPELIEKDLSRLTTLLE